MGTSRAKQKIGTGKALLLGVLVSLPSAISCKPRQFNQTTAKTKSSSSAAGGSASMASLLVDSQPAAATPPRNYVQDSATDVGSLSAKEYSEKISTRTDNPPQKFAAASVLKAFRFLRSLTHTKDILGWKGEHFNISTLVNSQNPTYDEAMKLGGKWSTSSASDKSTDFWVYTMGDNDAGTLVGEEAIHWNDLQAHFYAATANRRHACYTSVFRTARGFMSPTGTVDLFEGNDFGTSDVTTPDHIRDAAIQICGWGRPLKPAFENDPGWNYVTKTRDAFQSIYHKLWIDSSGQLQVLDLGTDKEPWITKRAAAEKKGWVNMFDYVMLSQTFAFDFEQQEAVVNSYYSDFKQAHEGSPLNLSDADECNKWRPARGGSMDGASGTDSYCNWEKKTRCGTEKATERKCAFGGASERILNLADSKSLFFIFQRCF